MAFTRNEFLKLTGMTGLAASVSPLQAMNFSDGIAVKLNLGLASYTLRNFNIDYVVSVCKKLELNSVSLKSFHLPLDSTPEKIKEVTGKIREAGIDVYGAGVIYMKTEQEVLNAFAYAKHGGFKMIIGVPDHSLLPFVNDVIKDGDIKLAIHNHGPEDKLYPGVDAVHAKIKYLDSRIGYCIDIGHVTRNGQDAAAMIKKYKDRLFDIHMKDVNAGTGEGAPVEAGHGVINIPDVLKALKKIMYTGSVAFEYEKDGEDPLAGLAESVGYVRGILKMI